MIEAFGWADIPPQDEALRAPVRAFLAERLAGTSSARRARSWLGFDAEFTRDLAQQGWVGLTLPKAYGGWRAKPLRAVRSGRGIAECRSSRRGALDR